MNSKGTKKKMEQLFTNTNGLTLYPTCDSALHQSILTPTQQRYSEEVKRLEFDPLVSCDKSKDDMFYSGNGITTIEVDRG